MAHFLKMTHSWSELSQRGGPRFHLSNRSFDGSVRLVLALVICCLTGCGLLLDPPPQYPDQGIAGETSGGEFNEDMSPESTQIESSVAPLEVYLGGLDYQGD